MTNMTDDHLASAWRAHERAKEILKLGDRISYTMCADTRGAAIMTGWDGYWICSKTKNDISPRSVYRVNGVPISFDDPL